MRAAYLNQAVNFLIGILMVPLLLKFLPVGDYVLWAIFTTFGGITLQIESALQVFFVREISRQYQSGDIQGLHSAIGRARKAYWMLALGVLVPFALAGVLYLSFLSKGDLNARWLPEWLLFVAVYALNYAFGANNATALALGRVSTFNSILAVTRTINFAISSALLVAGYGVMGLCISFAVSVALSCALNAALVSNAQRQEAIAPEAAAAPASVQHGPVSDIVRYMIYSFAAFGLYKGALLVAAGNFSKPVIGSYGLTLQIFTVLTACAVVPIQVWLNRLVKENIAGNVDGVIAELGRTLAAANFVYLAGTAAFLLTRNALLGIVGSSISLPDLDGIVLVAAAFLIEMNLVVLINVLVTRQRYDFVWRYAGCAAAGAVLGGAALALTKSLFLSFVMVPLIVQAVVCLPLIVKLLCDDLGMTPGDLLRRLARTPLVASPSARHASHRTGDGK